MAEPTRARMAVERMLKKGVVALGSKKEEDERMELMRTMRKMWGNRSDR
jgi:hypothetical protein